MPSTVRMSIPSHEKWPRGKRAAKPAAPQANRVSTSMKLSIGQAWDDTKAVFRADGGAIFAVALALTVLPGAILETAAPSGMRNADTHWSIALLGFVAALLSLTSQIAVSRIALGHPTTVGAALALAFRRVLSLL